jgi:hypothetical protein
MAGSSPHRAPKPSSPLPERMQATPMKVKLGDILLAAAVVIVSVVLIVVFTTSQTTGNLTAVVSQDGKEIKRIQLDAVAAPYSFEVDGAYHDVISVEKGRIRFSVADCPDKSCVHTGWIDRSGQTAVCLPNRTVVKLIGNTPGVDIISN